MYSLMIVDDEYMILRGMTKIIDWDSLEISLVKKERSPLQALEYLKENHVDILISDMNMAEMEGTKFLPLVKNIQPDIQIIVLSGYNDFDYAKASLEVGVVDYLNKPVDPEELEETVQKTKRLIKSMKQRKENSILAKRIKTKEILNGEKKIGNEGNSFYIVSVLNFDDSVMSLIDESRIIVGTYWDRMDMFIVCKDDYSQVCKLINNIEKLGFTIIISDRTLALDISEVTKNIKEYLAWLHFYGPVEKTIDLRHIPTIRKSLDVRTMNSNLDFYNEEMSVVEFRKMISAQIESLRVHYNAIEDAKYFARLILMSIYGAEQVANADLTNAIVKIEHTKSSLKIIDLLTDFYANYRKENSDYPEVILNTIKIIKTSYKKSLTLIEVSENLHLNSVYLGALFKKNTGLTFAQFLNSYRISKSIELMRTTDKDINDIAIEVGYQNVNYFFRVFKKQTKMAPREYRRMSKKRKL